MKGKSRIITILISLVLCIAMITISIALTEPSTNVEAKTEEPKTVSDANPTPEPVPEPEEVKPNFHFFNLDLQYDQDSENDYNFGCEPDCDANPQAMDTAFRNRLNQDPALGAADLAWFDCNLGTDYMGLFYAECKNEWPAAINHAKFAWVDDPYDYAQTLEAFYGFLDSAVSIEIREQKGITDQMYMAPWTKSGIPNVLVLETDDHEGQFLVYTFVIKGTKKVEVAYRINCGFQPCNVAEIMKVTPQKKRSGGGGSKSGGGSIISGGGRKPGITPTPTPTPTVTPPPRPTPSPTPKPKKDPKEGTKVLPNDDQGPGENTNNPADPNHSKKDLPSNSTEQNPEEYKQTIEEMKEANENNNNSDTPSTPPPTPDTSQDSNSSNLDGGTPESSSSVSNESGDNSWGGPPE